MKQTSFNKQILFSIIGVTVLIVAVVGVSFAFFNYTRTGGAITESGYTNGTTTGWINGRTVMTTAQWNALNSTGASFKIKVVAEEGSAA